MGAAGQYRLDDAVPIAAGKGTYSLTEAKPVSQEEDQSISSIPGRFLGAAWENLNPMNLIKAGLHPIDTAHHAFAATVDALDRFDAAKEKGDWKEAANAMVGAVPLLGPAGEQIVREIEEGKHAEALGHAAGLRLAFEAPNLISKIPAESVANAGLRTVTAAKGAVQGGMEPVGYRGFKVPAVVAGAAGGKYLGPVTGLPAEAGAAIGAALPMIKGARTALNYDARAAEAIADLPEYKPAQAAPPAATPAEAPVPEGVDPEVFKKYPPAVQDAIRRKMAGEAAAAPSSPTPQPPRDPSYYGVEPKPAEAPAPQPAPAPPAAPAKPNVPAAEAERAGASSIKGYASGKPGVEMETDPNSPRLRKIVYRDSEGKPQGFLTFYTNDAGTAAAPPEHGAFPQVYVNESARRSGVATQMYDAAKQHGFDLSEISGKETTPAGAAFVNARKGITENPDLTQKLQDLLRREKIKAGLDPDLPLGEVKGGRYLNKFDEGSNEGVIQSQERKPYSTAEPANPGLIAKDLGDRFAGKMTVEQFDKPATQAGLKIVLQRQYGVEADPAMLKAIRRRIAAKTSEVKQPSTINISDLMKR